MKEAGNEDVVIAAMRDGLVGEGVYMVPGISGDKMNDAAASAAYSAKAKTNPNAFIVYQPQGADGMDMGQELGQEFVTNVVSSFLSSGLGVGAGRFRFPQARSGIGGHGPVCLDRDQPAVLERVPVPDGFQHRRPAATGHRLDARRCCDGLVAGAQRRLKLAGKPEVSLQEKAGRGDNAVPRSIFAVPTAQPGHP